MGGGGREEGEEATCVADGGAVNDGERLRSFGAGGARRRRTRFPSVYSRVGYDRGVGDGMDSWLEK